MVPIGVDFLEIVVAVVVVAVVLGKVEGAQHCCKLENWLVLQNFVENRPDLMGSDMQD